MATHADSVLGGLSATQLQEADQILLRLVTPEGTRRTVPWGELLDGLGDGAPEVLRRLTESRLIASHRSSGAGQEEASLELAHESLVSTWGRLARLLDDNREERVFLTEVGPAADLWQRRGRRAEEVWQGQALLDALSAQRRCTSTVPAPVRRFLEAGRRRRIRIRRLRLAGAVLIVALLVGAVTAWVMSLAQKERQAQKQRRKAELSLSVAKRASARASLNVDDPPAARAHLREAMEIVDDPRSRRLWFQLQQQPLLWTHTLGSRPHAIAASPDGRWMAASQDKGPVILVDARLEPRAVFQKKTGVRKMRFSPNSKLLAAGFPRGKVELWDLARRTSRTLPASGKTTGSLHFDPSGQHLFQQTTKRICRWDLRRPAANPTCQVYKFPVAMGFTRTGVRVVDLDWRARRMLVKDGFETPRQVSDLPFRMLISARLIHGGQVLVAPGVLSNERADETAFLVDLRGGKQRMLPAGDKIRRVIVSRDERLLALSTDKYQVQVWDLRRDRLVQTFQPRGKDWVTAMAFSADSRRLLVGRRTGRLSLWSVERRMWNVPDGHKGLVTRVVIAPGTGEVVSAGRDGRIIFWNGTTGRRRRILDGRGGPLGAIAFSADGAVFVTAGKDGIARLWRRMSLGLVRELRGHAAEIRDVAFSPDSSLVATCGARSFRLWAVDARSATQVFKAPCRTITFHPDGKTLAMAGSSINEVLLLDVASGARRKMKPGGLSWRRIAFSAGGLLAVRGMGDVISLHDIETGKVVGRVGRGKGGKGRRLVTRNLAPRFDPAGKRLVLEANTLSCRGCSARIVSLQTRTLARLPGSRAMLSDVAFGPRGELLAQTSYWGGVNLWELDTRRPRWHAPLLLGSPPRLFTRRGVRSKGDTVARAAKKQWERAVTRQAWLAAAHQKSHTLCLVTFDGQLQFWDTATDRRLVSRPRPAVRDLVALAGGCATLERGQVALLQGSGKPRILKHPRAGALSLIDGNLYVAHGKKLTVHDSRGAVVRQRPFPANVQTLCLTGKQLVVGHLGGLMQLVGLGPPGKPPTVARLEDASASPVVRVARGPAGTVMAGFVDGTLAIWDRATLKQLYRAKLDGPVLHLLVDGGVLHAASERGQLHEVDLSALTTPYCKLLDGVWAQVPWHARGEKLVSRFPDPKHRCRRGFPGSDK